MKTIDIHGKEWRDRLNGNTYHSVKIVIDYGKNTPYEYIVKGEFKYLTSNLQYASELLRIPNLWQYCRDNRIILREYSEKNCKKREVIQWGKTE